jgi:hypothetical protein
MNRPHQQVFTIEHIPDRRAYGGSLTTVNEEGETFILDKTLIKNHIQRL